ncbi:MAG: DNA-protecting protein DprA [Candidatus Sungbacteria bacterium]|nr:DNA-protecting protein DprA [Candidatus Sungbacteria bacterium]
MTKDSDQKKFLNALLSIPGVGYDTIQKIKERFHSYEKAWNASGGKLTSAAVDEKTADAIERGKKTINPDQEMLRLEKTKIILLEKDDPAFPKILREIPSPPLWLYKKGAVPEDEEMVAIVGSRKATSYGKEATGKIISGLAAKTSVAVISGLAIGIDGEAHRAAIKHGLRTIAVIGTGLDENSFFPPQHLTLAREIVERGGAILSEYPLGMPALKQNFVQRNRLIAGLAKGTLVIEAAEKSGALITARFALEQGKSVMAVPGSIFSPYSIGTNSLIREGARVVISADDVIDELNLETKAEDIRTNNKNRLTDDKEKTIYESLDRPLKLDELIEKLNFPLSDIISGLSMLELKGMVKNVGGEWIRM